jgi:lysophospholipase L1-like esterase
MRSKKSLSSRFATFLLVLISLTVSLILCEYLIRVFYPQRLYYNVTQWDPYVGFTLIPDLEADARHEDYVMHMKINSRGLRDREYPYQKPGDTVRIGIFGDSFTFGEGVQNDETYPNLLEEMFNRDDAIVKANRRIEVLNFGIGKSGTSHQLAWYQKEGRKYGLDIVIVGFLSANDFTDNWSGVFNLKDNRLVHNPAAYSSVRRIQSIVYSIPFYKWLAANSHLVNLVRMSATLIDDRMRSRDNDAGGPENAEAKIEISDNAYELTLRLIAEFQKEATEDGAGFMIVNLPAKNQKPLSAYADQEQIKEHVIRGEALMNDLARTNVKLLNLVPVFATLPVSKYYFEQDGHMTRFGHQVIAENLHSALSQDISHYWRELAGRIMNRAADIKPPESGLR